MTPLEVRLFDAAWGMAQAIAGGGPLPHQTPEEAAASARELLLTLLVERNAYEGLVPGYGRPSRTAACDVLLERYRQLGRECWSAEHDDRYADGQLAHAAASYARRANGPPAGGSNDFAPGSWPWDTEWWKPGDPRRMLVKAGALILAEIERLDRAAGKAAAQ